MYGKFTGKARFVTSGNMTNPPSSLTYSRIVSGYSFLFYFTIADLNDLDIWAFDIGNSYLN